MRKVLNLFAGIGGNREKWGDDVSVTAVENNQLIADFYKERFPKDEVVVSDALDFLEERYHEYDFVWASPPCQSHGQYRHAVGVLAKGFRPLVPDMRSLYGTVVFLRKYHKGYWAVENTVPYYTPLIFPTVILARHLIWSNFPIAKKKFSKSDIRVKNKLSDFGSIGNEIMKTKIPNKRQALRNCVDSDLGKYVFDQHLLTFRTRDGIDCSTM